jgi:hypothetical protein
MIRMPYRQLYLRNRLFPASSAFACALSGTRWSQASAEYRDRSLQLRVH